MDAGNLQVGLVEATCPRRPSVSAPLVGGEVELEVGERRGCLVRVFGPSSQQLAATAELGEGLLDLVTGDPAQLVPGDPLRGVALQAVARERALVRGEHLVRTLGDCLDCHAADAGGAVIMDNPPMGRWIAPNLTQGAGRVGGALDVDAWVLAIRHGITSDRSTSTMPSFEYTCWSDREIGDVIAYMRSLPPVDRELPDDVLGPLRAVLIAVDRIPWSAGLIDHAAPRPALPPQVAATPESGRHLAHTCIGCHNPSLSGGPIAGGDPSWPPAPKLTMLQEMSLEPFDAAMRQGIASDGSLLRASMPTTAFAQLLDLEIVAMHRYW